MTEEGKGFNRHLGWYLFTVVKKAYFITVYKDFIWRESLWVMSIHSWWSVTAPMNMITFSCSSSRVAKKLILAVILSASSWENPAVTSTYKRVYLWAYRRTNISTQNEPLVSFTYVNVFVFLISLALSLSQRPETNSNNLFLKMNIHFNILVTTGSFLPHRAAL